MDRQRAGGSRREPTARRTGPPEEFGQSRRAGDRAETNASCSDTSCTLPLVEEELVARKAWQQTGEVVIRKRVETVPGHLEAEKHADEVVVEHEPVGQIVGERRSPYVDDGTYVVPVYEEQLVLVKRLVLKENLRIRKVAVAETAVFDEPIQREVVDVEDPDHTGAVRQSYPTRLPASGPQRAAAAEKRSTPEPPPSHAEEPQPESGLGKLLQHLLPEEGKKQ